VKHNREEEFERGTLEHAFAAVSACVALLFAQFGLMALGSELFEYVDVQSPVWPIEDMYLSPMTEVGWAPIPHPDLVSA
jgi:hypothetical protein